MRVWITILTVALLLISIAGLGAAAPKCHIESNQNISLAGFMFFGDSATYYQMLKDEDFTAAEKFLTEKIYQKYAIIFENGEEVYVNERIGDDVKVRRPGETELWAIPAYVVVYPY
jgi:hypothetical protein